MVYYNNLNDSSVGQFAERPNCGTCGGTQKKKMYLIPIHNHIKVGLLLTHCACHTPYAPSHPTYTAYTSRSLYSPNPLTLTPSPPPSPLVVLRW